jgi:hypothetical protein
MSASFAEGVAVVSSGKASKALSSSSDGIPQRGGDGSGRARGAMVNGSLDAELEEFAVDPGSAPQRVGEAHVADQLADFEWHFRSADSRARLPSPEQAKPGPVPADNRLRFDDQQGVQNVGCDPIEARKNKSIKIAEDKPLRRFSLQHIELVAQRQDLHLERGARPEGI